MDSPWIYTQYTPSSACEVAPHVPLDPDVCPPNPCIPHQTPLTSRQFIAETTEIIAFTKSLKLHPYDPETWLNRGNALRLLGYPELALGDIQKSRLLVEAGLSPTPSPLRSHVLKTFRAKTHLLHTTDPAWLKWAHTVSTPALLSKKVEEMLKRLELQIWTELMEGLMAANCCGDYLTLSQEAVRRFPEDSIFPSEVRNAEAWYAQRSAILAKSVENGEMNERQRDITLVNGGVYPVPYPFMGSELLVRNEGVFEGIRGDFGRVSGNCMVVRSTIRDVPAGDGVEASTEDDCIGAIATRDIVAGETVLVDIMSAGSVGVDADPSGCPTCCASPVRNFWNTCCEVLYCSQVCADTALETFHGSICGRDFEYLYTAARKATVTTDFSIDALLLMRVLALSLEEGAEHPLKSTLLVRLTPAYNFAEPNLIIFNFVDHILTPIAILQTLDIDIFANPLYDTWVLHTMKCRLQNNKHGQTLEDWPGTSISGLYSMLNHSCAPNVDWRHDGGSSEVTMFTTRDCRQGEELCISYIGAEGNALGVVERRKKLMGWFGMACRCVKCVEEAAALDDGVIVPVR